MNQHTRNERMLKVELPQVIIDELQRLAQENDLSCQEELIRRLAATYNNEGALVSAYIEIQDALEELWGTNEETCNEIYH